MPINPPKCTALDYINFLIAASTVYSCTEAARCYSSLVNAPSHDCFTRLLQNQSSDTESLWNEVRKFVTPKKGYMIVDDTILEAVCLLCCKFEVKFLCIMGKLISRYGIFDQITS